MRSSLTRLLQISQLGGVKILTQVWPTVKPHVSFQGKYLPFQGKYLLNKKLVGRPEYLGKITLQPLFQNWESGSVGQTSLRWRPRGISELLLPCSPACPHTLELCRDGWYWKGTLGNCFQQELPLVDRSRNCFRFPWSWAHRRGSINPHWLCFRDKNIKDQSVAPWRVGRTLCFSFPKAVVKYQLAGPRESLLLD